ncbi:hypothetical protein Pfo_006826 [Paulownia fortunei]|nr:hypothetical protein Pfo_006826 [Paulownia fortunei]
MDDLNTLARDFGFGPRGKSNPMRSAQPDRRPIDEPLFSDVFGGPAKYTPSSNSNNNNKHSSMSDFDYDSIFNSSAAASEAKKTTNSSSKTSSFPVYDKPVYDEDIFDGLPGLKSKSASSTVRFDNDAFASISSPPLSKSGNQNNDFDDLLGNLGRNEKAGENIQSNSAKSSSSSKGFDDLLAGFGSGISAASNRPIPESNRGSIPVGGSKHGSVLDDPFVVLESSSTQGSSSSGVFTDPLEEISKLGKSRSAKAEASSGGGGGFDDLDPLNSFGKSAHSFSPGRDKRGKEGSPSRSATPQSATTREQKGNSSFRYSESNMEKKIPVDNFQEPPLFDMPNVSKDFQKSFGQTDASPQYFETSSQVDMSPTSSGQGQQFDDVWLTVSEVPLFTQPIAAPPPSRPPPPIPRQTSRSETGSFSSSSRKKGDEFFSPSNYSQHSQSPMLARPAAKDPPVSQFDELEDFATGRSQNSVDESANLYSGETNAFSAAAASAAAMKEAMEKAEAKFRHAKEVREREYAKAARNKESVQLEKDEQDGQEREFRETEERLERERNQKEEEEREQRHQRERERSREIERDKGRQAVERANREARERAAVQARERAVAEARLKAERAAVEKANAEARERAGRVAVQRVQAEARERAAAEAKERAEKAAAEARERAAAAEAREKELRDKAAVARAEADARRRAERAAVERAAAEARERAAADVRERAAAAAAKMSQQRNDDDLESFFSMGRASCEPRGRANSTDPFFDQQFQSKGGSEAAKRTSSSSGASYNMKKASSTTNIVDDLSSIFGAGRSSVEFQEVEGETEERRRARLDRHQRTQERAAKALAEKNQRDLQAQREQEERHRIAETLDIEIKRWAAGKEGNLRALLSTLQYVLWPECGWQPVSLTDLITGVSVKKVYRKATLCIHPDKVQQKGATLQQKYVAEKVFDLLKEAWNKFNSEELF